MCGLVGIYRTNQKPVDKAELQPMVDILAHRGPDGEGIFIDKNVGLGHRRLAIIDLSPGGSQPMCNDDGSVCLVFNGEIYNYRELRSELLQKGHDFRSQSDTEVILRAYEEFGGQCAEKLTGMFAFAIWDKTKASLFCARDRFGIKPFYYFWDGKNFIFASEPKALIIHPLISDVVSCNPNALYRFFQFGVVAAGTETFFSGIQSLKPAECLSLAGNTLKKWEYWRITHFGNAKISDELAIESFREVFSKSVKQHLISDVPVGTFLSGGLDSSSIVCVAAKMLDHPVRTYTIYYEQEPDIDERSFAQKVIDATGASAVFYTLPNNEIPELLEKMIYFHDFPVPTPHPLSGFALMRLASRSNTVVLLNGQGSDEMLAGYFSCFPFFLTAMSKSVRWGAFFRNLRLFAKDQRLGAADVVKILLKSALLGVLSEEHAYRLRGRLGYCPLVVRDINKKFFEDIKEKSTDKFTQFLYNLTFNTNLSTLLHFEDRNSMAFSVEVRVPFLDHRLAETIFALPPHYKIRNGLTKWILREAMRNILPEEIRMRKDKKALEAIRESYWFRNELKEPLNDLLTSQAFRSRPIYDHRLILKLVKNYNQGDNRCAESLWKVFTMENWFRIFIDNRYMLKHCCPPVKNRRDQTQRP